MGLVTESNPPQSNLCNSGLEQCVPGGCRGNLAEGWFGEEGRAYLLCVAARSIRAVRPGWPHELRTQEEIGSALDSATALLVQMPSPGFFLMEQGVVTWPPLGTRMWWPCPQPDSEQVKSCGCWCWQQCMFLVGDFSFQLCLSA